MDHQFWWPGRFWPKTADRAVTRESFLQAFAARGYDVCNDPDVEAGFEKIVLYELDGVPAHAARQLPDGRWSSKLGRLHDITHTLDALNGDRYGEPTVFLKRRVKK